LQETRPLAAGGFTIRETSQISRGFFISGPGVVVRDAVRGLMRRLKFGGNGT